MEGSLGELLFVISTFWADIEARPNPEKNKIADSFLESILFQN
jgi:hypothetical protein